MDSFETEYRWAQKGWSDCRDALRLAQKELDESRARAQRIEATLVLVEDQRDKGFAERDALISAAMDTVHKGITAYNAAIAERDEARAERDKAQSQRDGFLADLERVIAERDSAITERDAAVARAGVLRAELHYERQQHASTREMLRAKERGNT